MTVTNLYILQLLLFLKNNVILLIVQIIDIAITPEEMNCFMFENKI